MSIDYELIRQQQFELRSKDIALNDPNFLTVLKASRSQTITSEERMYALYTSVRHVVNSNIPGDFVECGVWRGGSAMNMALTLLQLGRTDRGLWLYDTFEGMTSPENVDVDLQKRPANALLKSKDSQERESTKCEASLDLVKKNMISTGYPLDRLQFIKGRIEETVPDKMPSQISLLRLDTDWYRSTRHELEHLYPRLSSGGILIIDDYGHWEGCRKAVDEYFDTLPQKVYMHRIDYSGRLMIKP